MDVLSAIEKRREITRYTEQLIPESVLDAIVQALYLAPSGNNIPSREYIVVKNKESLLALAPTSPYMKWLEQAAAAVVIIANPHESKYWLQDASIAGAFAWLTATSHGVGAAWGAVYHSEDEKESAKRESFVREQLNIPKHYRVVAILGFGYAAEEPPKKEMYPIERILHQERFTSDS